MYIIFFIFLISLIPLINFLLKRYLKIPKHPYYKLSYNEKKEIIEEKFSKIKSSKIKLKKYTSNIFRKRNIENNKNFLLDLNYLTEIIDIDLENKIIHTEGLITFEKLLSETLKYHLIPKIIPEFKSLTVSGTISGLGIESSSFKYGLVPDMITEMEILLGTGEIIIANKDINSDIFYGIPNSYGSFGYILSAKIELIEAKLYVKTENILFTNPSDFIKEIKKYDNLNNPCDKFNNIDFLDGVIFNPNEMYLIKGKMTDYNPFPNKFKLSKYHYDIYYKSIKKHRNDLLKIEDYIWRYDSNIFYSKGIVSNKLFRYFMGDLLTTSNLKRLGEYIRYSLKKYFNYNINNNKTYYENVPNDLSIPLNNFETFLNWFDENLGNYPVWICPYFVKNPYKFFENSKNLELDFGINFGHNMGIKSYHKDRNYYKKLIDKKMYEMKKNKGLYPKTFLSEKQFWELYDKDNVYFELKNKYDPFNRFWNLFEKTVKSF